MFKRCMTFLGCLAMSGNFMLISAATHASEQDECVRVTAVGSGFDRKIVVSTSCNRPSKGVKVFCGVPGGYITSHFVQVWPGKDFEIGCDGRRTSNGSGAQWCYLINPRSDESCM
jgi:hypothetical protein